MGINITEIGQKVLDNNTNAANVFRKMYDLYYNSNPLDVPFEYIDENGKKVTTTIKNQAGFRKKVWDDVGSALGQFNRTFYVDAENGDDNNTGASDSPFKTIKKAVASTPIGGVVSIALLASDNYISDDILVVNKMIYFIDKTNSGDANLTFDTYTDADGNILFKQIQLNSSYLNVSSIKITSNNTTNTQMSTIFYKTSPFLFASGFNQITGYNPTINLVADALITIYPNTGVFGSLGIFGCSVDGTIYKGVIQLLSGASCNLLFSSSTNNADDGNGNTTPLINGIVKDSNGVPRNVISNIVF